MRNDPEMRRKIASTFIRGDKGLFVKKPRPPVVPQDYSQTPSSASPTGITPPISPVPPTPTNPLVSFLSNSTHYSRTQDDLLDVHVGNPLRKIQMLLEDIKKQKAFSFDIKGSLGMAGIAVTLGAFGIFGGTKALCSKGVQTKIGILRVLPIKEVEEVSILDRIPVLNWYLPKSEHDRVVLIDSQRNAIHLILDKKILPQAFQNTDITATGEYNSCESALEVESPANLLPY